MIDVEKMKTMERAIRTHDPLTKFLCSEYEDLLVEMRKNNFNLLLEEASKHKVRYIYINQYEICGCEDSRGPDKWPLMWYLTHKLGISGGCGNKDQHQITSSVDIFGFRGAWDLKENRKLTAEETAALPFHKVVERHEIVSRRRETA